jgi:hypothetical protein
VAGPLLLKRSRRQSNLLSHRLSGLIHHVLASPTANKKADVVQHLKRR